MLATIRGIIRVRLVTDPSAASKRNRHTTAASGCAQRRVASARSTAHSYARSTISRSRTKTGDSKPPHRGGQALRGACGRSSRTAARSSGRCRPAWATSCSHPLRGARSEACASSSSTGWRTCGLARAGVDRRGRWRSTCRPRRAAASPTSRSSTCAACRAGRRSRTGSSSWTARAARGALEFESHWDRRAAAARRCRSRRDFDLVVLAVGAGAVPRTCARSSSTRARTWRDMVTTASRSPRRRSNSGSRRTWRASAGRGGQTNLAGFVEPFDTWADMPQLIREESFPMPVKPRLLLQRAARGHPRATCRSPRTCAGGATRCGRTPSASSSATWPPVARKADAADVSAGASVPPTRTRVAAGRVEHRLAVLPANVDPSDRYTLSLPGSCERAISPLDHTFDNLTIAGDWTDCGFNEGCVEAAVMSGRLAAHAIAMSPALEQIVGFDHP